MRLVLFIVGSGALALAPGSAPAPRAFTFRGFETTYVKREGAPGLGASGAPPAVLVHGFGGSSRQWRATLADVAASGRTVYALDLLGFGSSAKPALAADSTPALGGSAGPSGPLAPQSDTAVDGTRGGLEYSIDTWGTQLLEFVEEVVIRQDGASEAVLVGNSIGSLVCLAAASSRNPAVAGVGLFNCAIGMNSKAPARPDDPIAYKIFFALFSPAFKLIDLLLASPLARALFDKVRDRENVRGILESGVYVNQDRVDDELVELITAPAEDEGALDAFIKILTGDPGPRPESLVPQLTRSLPIAVWWGTEDQVTPLIGVVGQFFKNLPKSRDSASFELVEGTGHCPFDDRPDLVSPKLIGWLDANFLF